MAEHRELARLWSQVVNSHLEKMIVKNLKEKKNTHTIKPRVSASGLHTRLTQLPHATNAISSKTAWPPTGISMNITKSVPC